MQETGRLKKRIAELEQERGHHAGMNRSDGLRLAYGLALVARPGILVRPTREPNRDRLFMIVVRVLGGRHIVQAVVTGIFPTRRVRRLGAVADALHAATDIGCAAAVPARRWAASIDAGVAVAFAAAALRNRAR